jgi:hypothetical protein
MCKTDMNVMSNSFRHKMTFWLELLKHRYTVVGNPGGAGTWVFGKFF